MGRLRRWRLLTLVLLLAAPGLAGTALAALHPCPESAPWIASSAPHGGEPAAHVAHGSHGAGHEAPAHGADCHCVGACVGAAVTIPVAPPLPTAMVAAAPALVIRAPAGVLPAQRPSDRLPPATAPPLV